MEKIKGTNHVDEEKLRHHIIRKLSKTTPFTAFKRWIVKDNSILAEFEQHFD